MKYSNMLTIPAAVALLALGGPRAQAATFTVTNLDDTGIGSLRHAILSADIVSGADAVVFQAGLTGTIHLSADEGELPIIGDLLIEGPGPTALTVSGSNVTSVFSITAGSTVMISGLSITEGHVVDRDAPSHSGGGISNSGNLTLSNCIVSGNEAGILTNTLVIPASGGGIFNTGNLTLTDCAVSGNKAEAAGGGGGIFSRGGELTLTGCILSGNSASVGGGIDSHNTATLTDCTFFANSSTTADRRAGGINNGRDGRMTAQNCTVAGNGAIRGGGIFNAGDLRVINCTVNGNIATFGAGIANRETPDSEDPQPTPTLTMENSTVSGNRAFSGGGINNGGTVSLTNCTLSGNRADDSGGILNSGTGTVTLANTIVANSGAAPNCVNEGNVTSLGHNLDSDGTCGLLQSGDQSGTLAAPLDPLLGPLQNNGGPTETHALPPGSPALDAGDGTLAPAGTDQRGFPRIVDGDRNGSSVIDIGAYELGYFNTATFRDLSAQFVTYSTVSDLNTSLPQGTQKFNLTIHYSHDIDPDTFVAKINGQYLTHLFNPRVSVGFETVAIPLIAGQNFLSLRVRGTSKGRPAEDVDTLGFLVGDPPFGPR